MGFHHTWQLDKDPDVLAAGKTKDFKKMKEMLFKKMDKYRPMTADIFKK